MALKQLGVAPAGDTDLTSVGYKGATRTGVYQFELPNALSVLGASQFTLRRPFMVTQTVKRFRVHVKNYNHLGEVWATGSLTNFTVWVGAAAEDANGDLTGQCTTALTQIQTSTTLTNTELITGWVNPSTYSLTPNAFHILSMSLTTDGSVQLSNGGGMQWYSYSLADAGAATPTLARADNQGFLNVFIEFEFTNDSAPLILVVGNSLSGGGNTAGVANRGELDAWHQQWAQINAGVVASIAVGGSWVVQFGASAAKWNHYATLNTPLSPDVVVHMGTSSSDIAGGTPVATVKTNVAASVQKAQAMWPNARNLITTNPPRIASVGDGLVVGTTEYNRQQVNTWLGTSPCGVTECLDLESELTDDGEAGIATVSAATSLTLGNATPRLNAVANSGDGEHWSPRAHNRVAQMLSILRNR